MLRRINESKKPKEVRLKLARPNKIVCYPLKYIINKKHSLKYNALNTLSFDVPYFIEVKRKKKRNPVIDELKERYLVKAIWDNDIEWFVITKITKSANSNDLLSVECRSLGYELSYRKENYQSVFVTATWAITRCLKNTAWSIGYINPYFDSITRKFDVTNQTKLEFLFKIAEKFGGIVTFDTINRTINLEKESDLSLFKGFTLKDGQYIQDISDTIDSDETITRLYVKGAEDVTFEEFNITGEPFIDDFSYYIHPYAEGESSSYYFSDDLCKALEDYYKMLEDHKQEFDDLVEERESYKTIIDQLNTQLASLNEQLETEENESVINQINSNIKSIENSINTNTSIVTQISSEITEFSDSMKLENNLSEILLAELIPFIYEGEWSNDSISNGRELLEVGYNQHKLVNFPPINIEMTIFDFFKSITEQHNWDRLNIADLVRIKHNILKIYVEAKVVEINFDYNSDVIGIVISNLKRKKNNKKDIFSQMMYSFQNSQGIIESNKNNWNTVANKFNGSAYNFSETPSSPILSNDCLSYITNDNGSVDITFKWQFTRYTTSNNKADYIDGFIISVSSDSEGESEFRVVSDKRNFVLSGVTPNKYYTFAIKSYRSVYNNISPQGVLYSPIITPLSPYKPSDTVEIIANISGTLDGYSVSSNATPETLAVRDSQGKLDIGYAVATLGENGYIPVDLLPPTEPIETIEVHKGTYIGDGLPSRNILFDYAPSIVKIYTTNINDNSLYIPSTEGGFLMLTNIIFQGDEENNPTDLYGALTLNGFTTGNDINAFGNKNGIKYYWEAY